MQENKQQLTVGNLPACRNSGSCLPAIVAEQGDAGRYVWEEYFSGRIRNPYTRKAYLQAVRAFLGWVEFRAVDLATITPGLIGQYFDEHSGSAPTKKLHMSAIRGFFDVMVLRHVMILNPALSVRTEKYSALEGKTPEITVLQARQLLGSIHPTTPIDFRDQAIIGILIYTAARVGAVAKLRWSIKVSGTVFSEWAVFCLEVLPRRVILNR